MAKSKCGKKKDQHRKIDKSEVTNLPQDNHHSGDGSRAGRKPQRKANTYTRKSEKEELSQRDGGKGSTEKVKGNRKGEKTSLENTREEEATEIHIEEDLYEEVNMWAKNEIEKGDSLRNWKKETGKQPRIRDWLVTEERKERDGSKEETEGDKGWSKSSVQADTRAVIISQKCDRKCKEKKGDSRTVIVKKQEHRRQVVQKEDERIVLDRNEGWQAVKDKREVDVRNGPGAEILSRNWMNLTRADYRTIQGKRYLNDKIIDSYIHLIQERSEASQDLPTVYGLTTFFYTQLSTFGLEEGSRRTQDWIKEDLREKDWIFCPIHRYDHWTLIAVEIPTRTIHYLDSLVGSRNKSPAPGMFLRYMEAYYRKLGEEVQFKIRIRKDAPIQQNGVDCGVFLCQYAERLSRKGGFDFLQGDMPMARKKMTQELLAGKLDAGSRKGREVQQDKVSSKWTTKKTSKPKKKITVEHSRLEKAKEPEAERRKEKVQWPKANSPAWEQWDKEMTELLKTQSTTPESKAVLHPMLIYTMGKDRFGVKEGNRKKQEETKGPTRRQRKCKKLREDINLLKESYKNAREEEKAGIRQLQEGKLKELRLAKRAESLKKGRKKFTRNCNAFMSNPFEFAREVIAQRPKGKMSSSKEETESYLEKAHSNPGKDSEAKEDFHQYGPPRTEFDDSLPSWKEFNDRIQKARNKSAPGPNGVPYLVYKKFQGWPDSCLGT